MRKLCVIIAILLATLSSVRAQVPSTFKTVDTLNSATALTGSEYVPVFQTSNPLVKTTPAAIQTYLEGLNNTWTGTVNTTSTSGYQQNGSTIVKICCNSGNTFGLGPGTVTLVGKGAGAALPAADFLTTAIGFNALHSNTLTNTESTAVGWQSQAGSITGNMNTTLGISTLLTCVACNHDIGIGTDSFRNSTAGNASVGIGVSTLINDNAGSNIAIGDQTYQSNLSSTGNFNIAIGWATFLGTSLTTGTQNIVIGSGIAVNTTSGSQNVIIGHIAGTNITTAGQNTVVGMQATPLMTTGIGNTVVGWTGGAALTSGVLNTLIGYNAAPTLATGGGNIVIGVSNKADPGNVGNTLLIEGDGTTPTILATQIQSAAPFLTTGPTQAGGTKFTASGCSVSATLGGAAAGQLTSGVSGTCTVAITIAGATGVTANNAFSCWMNNITHPGTTNIMQQSVSTAVSATFTGTTVTGDVLNFGCLGY